MRVSQASGSLTIADALSFFRLSCGRWRSQRSVHHLLHRRAEAGGSLIVVEELDPGDSRLLAIAELHDTRARHALKEADILTVHVDVDKSAKLALLILQALTDIGKPSFERTEALTQA